MKGGMHDRFNPGPIKQYLDKKVNQKLEPLGITYSNVRFIMVIGRTDGISLKELSAAAMVDKSLTTRMAKSLMEKGLAENKNEGSREFSLVLTAEGRKAEEAARKAMSEAHEEMLSDLTESEMKQLTGILDKIMMKIKEEAGGK